MKHLTFFLIILFTISIVNAEYSLNTGQTSYITANPNEEITLIVQPNKQVDEWHWFIDNVSQNETSNKFSITLNDTNNRTITVYGSNNIENTTPIIWNVQPNNNTSFYSTSNNNIIFTFLGIFGFILLLLKSKIIPK